METEKKQSRNGEHALPAAGKASCLSPYSACAHQKPIRSLPQTIQSRLKSCKNARNQTRSNKINGGGRWTVNSGLWPIGRMLTDAPAVHYCRSKSPGSAGMLRPAFPGSVQN